MNAAQAFQLETAFLSGVEANLESAKGVHLRGTIWQRSHSDDGDALRAALAANRVYDRERLKSLPSNRRFALHGFERRFFFGKRRTGIAIASVLSPLEQYASSPDVAAAAIDTGELVAHVRKLVGDPNVPHVIGVCSPTGFTARAREARLDLPNVAVVLIEPDGLGGWKTTATGENVDPRVLKLFDPEGSGEKIRRVTEYLESESAALLTGGMSAGDVVEKLHLPLEVVRQGFDRAAAADPELRVSRKDGEFLLYRGAPARAQERKSMNMIDRLKQLFAREGGEAEKINLLAERRAALARRRDRMYEDIAKLETREAQLLAEGRAATSQVPKRRIAAQVAQLRKDIARQNATSAMLNKQIDIISTDIHNLTLIEQGEMAQLPSTEELTENAVRAEEMLETLKADADLVGELGTGIAESLTSDEELAILKELEGAPAEPRPEQAAERPQGAEKSPARAAPQRASVPRPTQAEASPEEPPSGPGAPRDRSRDREAL